MFDLTSADNIGHNDQHDVEPAADDAVSYGDFSTAHWLKLEWKKATSKPDQHRYLKAPADLIETCQRQGMEYPRLLCPRTADDLVSFVHGRGAPWASTDDGGFTPTAEVDDDLRRVIDIWYHEKTRGEDTGIYITDNQCEFRLVLC